MRKRLGLLIALLAVGVAGMPARQAAAAGAGAEAAASTAGVWAKLDDGLDTTFTKAGNKVSLSLESAMEDGSLKLPKGTKLTGTVVKSQKKDKQHANAGLVLLFDTAVLKDKETVPVHVSITALSPSPSDEIEKVEVGSGEASDAAMSAAKVAHELDDPNGHASASTSTQVNGVKVTSNINGVVLFASPDGSSSGVIVAKAGQQLELHKWTRFDVMVTPR